MHVSLAWGSQTDRFLLELKSNVEGRDATQDFRPTISFISRQYRVLLCASSQSSPGGFVSIILGGVNAVTVVIFTEVLSFLSVLFWDSL